MAGYIGSKASVVSSGAERKKTFTITGATTSLTGLNYTVGKVHVFQNGVRLVDGTDYTATNGTTITLTVAAQNGDNVVVISQADFQVSGAVSTSGDTMTGDLTVQGGFTSQGIDDNGNATAITIDSSGNVGIGTATLSTPLHIQPNSSGTITLGQQNLGNPTVFPTYTTSASYINSWLHGTGAGPYPRYVDLVSNGDGSSGGNIRLLTNPTGSSTAVERMRIESSGQVGIGIQTSRSILTVKGAGANGTIKVIPEAINAEAAIGFYQDTTGENQTSRWVAGVGGWGQTNQFVIGAGSSPKLKIDTTGRVTMPYQPSFRAGRNGNYVAGFGNDILFNLTSGTQLFNTGSHYSTTTGLFTAPVTGSYIFHVVIIWGPSMPEGEDMADSFRLVYNGTKFHYSERRAEYVNGSTGNGGYYVDHATCITHMDANDTMGVRSQESIGVHGNAQYTTFQGHLLG